MPAAGQVKIQSGVSYTFFDGQYSWVPQVDRLKPLAVGQARHLQEAATGKDRNGVVLVEGYLRVPQDGEYIFALGAGTSAVLRLHEALLLDADYGYVAGTERQASILLKAGLHPFRFYYTSKAGARPALDLQWQGPGISRQPIPANVFCRAAK